MQVSITCLLRGFLAAVALGIAGCESHSTDFVVDNQGGEVSLSPRGLDAYARLLVASRFTGDAVGYGGQTPDCVIALRRLALEPGAANAFAMLEKDATLAGKLFALCGLYYADPQRFQNRIAPYQSSQDIVQFLNRCIGSEVKVGDLVRKHGALALVANQSLKNWHALHPDAGRRDMDFLGGGWPNLLVKGGGYSDLHDQPYSVRPERKFQAALDLEQFGVPEEVTIPAPPARPYRIVYLSRQPYGLHLMNEDGSSDRVLVPSSQVVLHFDCGPSGIAYTCDPDDTENFELFIEHPDSLEQVPVDSGIRFAPTWLPDGRRLSFMKHSGRWMICVTPEDIYTESEEIAPPETTRFKHTGLSVNDGSPTWSPDGQTVVFASNRAETSLDLYSFDITTKELRRLTDGIRAELPEYSPDGAHVSFSSGENLYLVGSDGSGLRKLTGGVARRSRHQWFPDSEQLVFVSGEDENSSLCVFDLSDGSVRRLTDALSANHSPAISPEGQKILFVSNRDGNDEIYVMKTDGSGVLRLTQNEVRDAAPAWMTP